MAVLEREAVARVDAKQDEKDGKRRRLDGRRSVDAIAGGERKRGFSVQGSLQLQGCERRRGKGALAEAHPR